MPNLCGGGRRFFVSDISMMCEMPNHVNMIRHHDILNLVKHIPSIVGRLSMKKYHVGFTINYHYIDMLMKIGFQTYMITVENLYRYKTKYAFSYILIFHNSIQQFIR